MIRHVERRLLLCLVCAIPAARGAGAADEIQVYNAEINERGRFSLQMHGNYVPKGRTTPPFPRGLVPEGAFNGTPELALGLADFWEVGLYLPYAVTRGGDFEPGGAKLRTLFVVPHARARGFFYGINFELGYAPAPFAESRWNSEIRPIVGLRRRVFELIVNPIVDVPLSGRRRDAEFAPAARLAFILSPSWAAGVEHYADYGPLNAFVGDREREQVSFIVADYGGAAFDIDIGIGHGWTAGSDDVLLKTILSWSF